MRSIYRTAYFLMMITLAVTLLYKYCKIKILKIKRKDINKKKEFWSGILVIYLVGLLTVTLWPLMLHDVHRINLIPFIDLISVIKEYGMRDNLGNILKTYSLNLVMTIPYGVIVSILLNIKNKKPEKALISGLVLIIGIELLQYFMATGRAADISDVILNTCGIAIGIAISKLGIRVYQK